jgi:hypothetical protein
VAGTTATAGIGSRLDGKQRRGHDDDGSQRSRTDLMKTSNWKTRKTTTPSLFFFCRNNNNKKKSSAKSFAYCNRLLQSLPSPSLSLSLSPLSGRLTFKNAKFKTAKRARNFKFTHQSISP